MKTKKIAPLNQDGSERECPKCRKLIYNKKEGCGDCGAVHTPTLTYERLETPTCKDESCDIAENPEHWVEVSLSPRDLRAINSHEDLLFALKETHAEEIENQHYGDKKGTCSYCQIIARAEGRP